MDEAAIENAGISSIKPLLDRTTKLTDKTWLATTIELHKLGVWVVWGATAFADLADSTTTITYLDAAGLGLPDRDYYVKPDFKDKLEAYRAHVAKMLSYRVVHMQNVGMIPNHEASMAKLFSSELGQRISRTGIKMVGLYGVSWDRQSALSPNRGQYSHRYSANGWWFCRPTFCPSAPPKKYGIVFSRISGMYCP